MFVRNKSGNLVVGRVARDPEERTFNSGKSKVSLSVLYADDPDNRDENGRPKGLFLSVDAWGAVGRDCMLLTKGDYIGAVGRLDTHEYNGKTYTSLVADAVWSDMSTMMRIVVANVPRGGEHGGGTNAADQRNRVPADPFAELSEDEGELPF